MTSITIIEEKKKKTLLSTKATNEVLSRRLTEKILLSYHFIFLKVESTLKNLKFSSG